MEQRVIRDKGVVPVRFRLQRRPAPIPMAELFLIFAAPLPDQMEQGVRSVKPITAKPVRETGAYLRSIPAEGRRNIRSRVKLSIAAPRVLVAMMGNAGLEAGR